MKRATGNRQAGGRAGNQGGAPAAARGVAAEVRPRRGGGRLTARRAPAGQAAGHRREDDVAATNSDGDAGGGGGDAVMPQAVVHPAGAWVRWALRVVTTAAESSRPASANDFSHIRRAVPHFHGSATDVVPPCAQYHATRVSQAITPSISLPSSPSPRPPPHADGDMPLAHGTGAQGRADEGSPAGSGDESAGSERQPKRPRLMPNAVAAAARTAAAAGTALAPPLLSPGKQR